MHSITSAPIGATSTPSCLPSLGDPVYTIAGTCYTAAQFDALLEHGGCEAGWYELVPVRGFLAWLTALEMPGSAEAQRTPVQRQYGAAWIVSYLKEHDGSDWTAYDEGAQARNHGQPSTEPVIPYTPFERFLYSLPSCTPCQARSAVLSHLTRTGYTATWFSTLRLCGECGELIAPQSFLAWFIPYVGQAEETEEPNGAALAVTFLIARTGLLWSVCTSGLQPRLAGGPDIGSPVPYTPFERFLVSLPDSTIAHAQAAIMAYLAAH